MGLLRLLPFCAIRPFSLVVGVLAALPGVPPGQLSGVAGALSAERSGLEGREMAAVPNVLPPDDNKEP